MHYFESQLVSTVKPVKETDQEVVFVGHYRHGDGASIPGFALAFGATLPFFAGGGALPLSISGLLFVGAVAFAVFQKKITIRSRLGRVEVSTRTLFGASSTNYPVSDARLQAQKIHIRLAEDCGAIDLLLPDQTIRLSVCGRFDRSLSVTKRLSDLSGINMTVAQ